jgi:hypothetical protein
MAAGEESFKGRRKKIMGERKARKRKAASRTGNAHGRQHFYGYPGGQD